MLMNNGKGLVGNGRKKARRHVHKAHQMEHSHHSPTVLVPFVTIHQKDRVL
jgi:hypothetical protein